MYVAWQTKKNQQEKVAGLMQFEEGQLIQLVNTDVDIECPVQTSDIVGQTEMSQQEKVSKPKQGRKRKPAQINEKNINSSKSIGDLSISLLSLYRDPNVKKRSGQKLKGGQISKTMSLSLFE